MEDGDTVRIEIIWRGERMQVGMVPDSDVRELGTKLVKLTQVKPETMKLLIPLPTRKGSRLLAPFSSELPGLSLREAGALEGKPIRMMGVLLDEIAEVSQNGSISDSRIIGFDEEEERLRQRSLNRRQVSLKLPQGPYIFCEFRTLELPGLKLNPPASEALKRMHMLACDPGIIAIMNKHRWRVGIMTEMAPEGYVGISPKCILGFNKNQGEEISLRLRTDDLKGFRKYESIKKTLLHELAHMVYSEHDADFFALDKQLNQEAVNFDWTKSRGHTLAGKKILRHYEDEVIESSDYQTGQRLGGDVQLMAASARMASAAAAYNQLRSAKTEDSDLTAQGIPTSAYGNRGNATDSYPDESTVEIENEGSDAEPSSATALSAIKDVEPDPADSSVAREPDPDDLELSHHGIRQEYRVEPDPDESIIVTDGLQVKHQTGQFHKDPDPDDCNDDASGHREQAAFDVSHNSGTARVEPDLDDSISVPQNQELDRIEEPATAICNRLHMTIKALRSEAAPGQATFALQTLFKIISNVLDHPNDVKFRRLRKGNPLFQKNVANYRAAMEMLAVVGFYEDIIIDNLGMSEAYMILKRNDPGLLWLAKSSLEVSID